jgi:hypothetical protein
MNVLDGSQKSEDGRKRFNNSLKSSVFGQKPKFIETKVAALNCRVLTMNLKINPGNRTETGLYSALLLIESAEV